MAVQRRKPVPKELVWIQLRLRGHVPAQLARALAGALGLKTMVIIIIVVVCCACENVKRMPQDYMVMRWLRIPSFSAQRYCSSGYGAQRSFR